jgi:curved DNA-binding protein CbpA
MNHSLEKCYELPGLKPGATREELKAAYRDLARVWHPDRFTHDPGLQTRAQERLKQINEAYNSLISGRAKRARSSQTYKPMAPTGRALQSTELIRQSYGQ